MNPIPFCDLSRAHKPIRRELDRVMAACVDSSWFLRGPETRAFEEEWAAYCGQGHAVCCNSGTDALTLAATALNLKTATIQANTLPLTGTGLHRGGANVRIVDIAVDGSLDQDTEDAVPVLVFGRIPSTDAPAAKLYDAAHAHGWKPPATSLATWSFYPTKTLGALGDAGAITTHDSALAEEMRLLCGRDDQMRDHRQITSRIDEIQAAVLRIKLRHLDAWLAERQEIARLYDTRLSPLGITIPGPSLHHLYAVRVLNRSGLMDHLRSVGIETKVHWDRPLNRVRGPWIAPLSCPVAEQWCESVLSLPCYPGLLAVEITRVCDAIEAWHEKI
jgi:dTDP-4-amino-4,6-dideoxygalactose transaminase